MLTIEEKETSQDSIRQIKRKTRALLRSHGHIGYFFNHKYHD